MNSRYGTAEVLGRGKLWGLLGLLVPAPCLDTCELPRCVPQSVAAEAGVSAMPTFQVYVDGKKVEELVGAAKEKLEGLVKKYAA
jgi:Thioredoxin